ncbi:MAG: cache domain-containing protein, partial [Clostridia bacterium]|nr:cache domain-containing protein [Clostridia bacterium]
MEKVDKIKHGFEKVLYTAAAIIMLFVVVVATISHIYKFSEEQAFEKLHLETLQIKNNLNLQMLSDRENLTTMANFASKLHSDGEGYELLFKSFEEIGLFENIGILLPDNRFITKMGTLDMNGRLSFEEETARGEYISGRVKDLTNDEKEVVRSAVPITADDGTTVAMMYGLIELETLRERYIDSAKTLGADLFVLEGGNGNFIIDTKHDSLGNITELASTHYKDGFSYDKMITELTEGTSGYSAFMALSESEYMYVHYAPLAFAEWQIMLMKPEKTVFAGAKATGSYMGFMAGIIILIMLAYVLFIFVSERRNSKISKNASNIRKYLLEINQQFDRIYEALKSITVFANARSAFVVDTYGEDYNYIVPALKNKLLSGEERKYFIMKLLNYAARHREEHGAAVYLAEVNADKHLQKESPDFYEFIRTHGIEKISFAVIVSNSINTNLLGVINPKKRNIDELLKDIAICFSMAVYNKKHLIRTEAMAVTDALTGVANRMAYKQDIKVIKNIKIDKFT